MFPKPPWAHETEIPYSFPFSAQGTLLRQPQKEQMRQPHNIGVSPMTRSTSTVSDTALRPSQGTVIMFMLPCRTKCMQPIAAAAIATMCESTMLLHHYNAWLHTCFTRWFHLDH